MVCNAHYTPRCVSLDSMVCNAYYTHRFVECRVCLFGGLLWTFVRPVTDYHGHSIVPDRLGTFVMSKLVHMLIATRKINNNKRTKKKESTWGPFMHLSIHNCVSFVYEAWMWKGSNRCHQMADISKVVL